MKKLLSLLVFGLFLLGGGYNGFAEDKPCYKDAPAPHYTAERGYGWDAEMDCSDPADPHVVLKAFLDDDSGTITVFVDMDKDGACDQVPVFIEIGETNEEGQQLYDILGVYGCAQCEDWVKATIKSKKLKGGV